MPNRFEVVPFSIQDFQLQGRKPSGLRDLHHSVMRSTRDIRRHSAPEAKSLYARFIKQNYPLPGQVIALRLQWLATIRRAYVEAKSNV